MTEHTKNQEKKSWRCCTVLLSDCNLPIFFLRTYLRPESRWRTTFFLMNTGPLYSEEWTPCVPILGRGEPDRKAGGVEVPCIHMSECVYGVCVRTRERPKVNQEIEREETNSSSSSSLTVCVSNVMATWQMNLAYCVFWQWQTACVCACDRRLKGYNVRKLLFGYQAVIHF